MKKDLMFDLDVALMEIESLIDPANLMLFDLTQDFFNHDESQKDGNAYILYEYGRAATRAKIADDYVCHIKEKLVELRKTTNALFEEMRQHEG